MRHPPAGHESPRYAITDLYDEQRRTFLVQYPVLLVIVLGLSGVAAFALTGFLGTRGWSVPPVALDGAFEQPWVLYLWFSALMLTLLISIFRDASLRRRLIATVLVTLLAIVLVGILRFTDSLPPFIQNLLRHHYLVAAISQGPLSYTLINFGLIAIFWADTLRRWVRRARGLPPNPSVDIGLGRRDALDPRETPTLQELISGDLVAAALLTLLLAAIFQADFLGQFVHPVDQDGHVIGVLTNCRLSWPVGVCHGAGGGVADPPTLTFMNLIQTLIYLPLGLIILALSATLSGLGAVGGVDDAALGASLPATATGEGPSTAPIAVDVSTTILKALQSALDRRLRLLARNLILSVRAVGWPALIFVATYGLVELSFGVQTYLHSAKGLSNAVAILPAVGWGLVTVLGLVFSATLMLFRWRVAENSLRFLGLVGFVVLLTFWIFSLALWGINHLVLLVASGFDRHPFDPPSFSTYFSLGALVLTGIFFFSLRRLRPARPAVASPVAAPALVAAGTRADPAATTTMPFPSPMTPQESGHMPQPPHAD